MTFTGVTAAKLQAVKEHLSANGATVSASNDGNSGSISGHGIVATYALDPGGVLTVTIHHKPFYISEGTIEAMISDGLAKA